MNAIASVRHVGSYAVGVGCAFGLLSAVACSDDAIVVPSDTGVVADARVDVVDSVAVVDSRADDATVSDTNPGKSDSAVPEVAPQTDAPVTPDMAPSDTADAATDSPPEAGPRPFSMCADLDRAFGTTTTLAECATATTSNCPDRSNAWSAAIVDAFTTGGLVSDCRIKDMLSSGMEAFQYMNDLTLWNLAFFGCPDPSTPVASFALVPADLGDHQFTTPDLKLLSDLYVVAVDTALVDAGQDALTSDQNAAISAHLAELAATVPNRLVSSVYSFDGCPVDGGAGSEGGPEVGN